MPLKKIQIAEAIAIQLGFPIARAKAITETLLEIIKRSLESGNDILISGSGRFCVREKAARRGRNSATI